MKERISLCVFGAGGVGKSALTIKFVQNKFVDKYDPSVTDSYRKQEEVDGTMVHLEVVDTAGQEEYTALRATCYQKAEGFLAVYSVLDRGSFAEVQHMRDDVLAERGGTTVPMVLLANKCDVEPSMWKVAQQEGRALAGEWFGPDALSVPFFETSALEDMNVTEAFHEVVRQVRLARRTPQQIAAQRDAAAAARAAPSEHPPRHTPPPGWDASANGAVGGHHGSRPLDCGGSPTETRRRRPRRNGTRKHGFFEKCGIL